MLMRVYTPKQQRRKLRDGDQHSNYCSMSVSVLIETEDILIGYSDDLSLVSCDESNSPRLSLRQILGSSVGVMGESSLGMSEKVVLKEGKVFTVKRFRVVSVGKGKFGRRIEKLSQVSRKCEYLVPITHYLYSKRIKLVVSEYFPMGSLADLLAGGRDHGHTAVDWNQRLTIALTTARALAFIHSRVPIYEMKLLMNIHGNVKASNVLITMDLTARLSDYGYTQLANLDHEVPDASSSDCYYTTKLCQKSDIFNFGVILLDMLGGARAPGVRDWIAERKEKIKGGEIAFFELMLEGKEREEAVHVLEIALACTRSSPETRPSMDQVVRVFEDIGSHIKLCEY